MKKIVVFLSLFLSLGLIVQAQVKLERNTVGEYRVEVANKNWYPTNIVADLATLRYIKFFDEVISNPNKPILVYQKEKIIKLKPVFKKLIEVEKGELIYNQTTKKISLLVDKKREVRSSYLILFALISIMSMISSNLFFKENSGLAAAATVATAFATFTTFTFAALAAAALAAAFLLALCSHDTNNGKTVINTIIFCILMPIYVVLLYI